MDIGRKHSETRANEGLRGMHKRIYLIAIAKTVREIVKSHRLFNRGLGEIPLMVEASKIKLGLPVLCVPLPSEATMLMRMIHAVRGRGAQ